MKKILLTGGEGSIGKAILSSYLKDKYEILAPPRSELDLLDFDKVSDYVFYTWPDIIIHAASENQSSEALYCNTMMYQNITRFAYDCEKIINISSGTVYDTSRSFVGIKEEELGLRIPKDSFGYSKFLNAVQSAYNKSVTELFLFGIYGTYDTSPHLFDYFLSYNIKRMMQGFAPNIGRDKTVGYLDIDDFIGILDRFISTDKMDVWQRYNIVGDKAIKLSDMLNIVKNIVGYTKDITWSNDDCIKEPVYTGSNRRLLEMFPDIQYTSLEMTIEKLYAKIKELP